MNRILSHHKYIASDYEFLESYYSYALMRITGPDHPEVANTYVDLATAYRLQQDTKKMISNLGAA
jgi:hypothetical protein